MTSLRLSTAGNLHANTYARLLSSRADLLGIPRGPRAEIRRCALRRHVYNRHRHRRGRGRSRRTHVLLICDTSSDCLKLDQPVSFRRGYTPFDESSLAKPEEQRERERERGRLLRITCASHRDLLSRIDSVLYVQRAFLRKLSLTVDIRRKL